MNTLKLTLSKLFLSCLAVLFSVSFFSFKSNAASIYSPYANYDNHITYISNNKNVSVFLPWDCIYFADLYSDGTFDVKIIFFDYSEYLRFTNNTPSNVQLLGKWRTFNFNGDDVPVYAAKVPNLSYPKVSDSSFTIPTCSLNDTYQDYIGHIYDIWKNPVIPDPEYGNFGLKNFTYTTYTTNLSSKPKDGFILEYKLDWDGSTNPVYPITRVDYEIYGFRDRSYSNYDKSNGILLQTGEAYDGMNLDVDSAINDALNFPYDWDKVVVYFIPFSGKTEGNTEFIVCNLYKSELTLDLYGLNIPIGNLFLVKAEDGQGSIPVPYTSSVNDGTDSFPVSTIDDVPVLTIDQTISGSFNTYYDYFNSYTTYSPVIYGDTNTINNYYDQHSESITNNNDYSVIINNFNGSVDIDPDSEAYSESIISFLKTLITFFSTFWSYCVVALGWLPAWVQVFVSAIFGLLGTLVIGLGILKLMRGVL